ncbi:hypothetical protein ACJJTC_006647 [Scirpophaga incertulas]
MHPLKPADSKRLFTVVIETGFSLVLFKVAAICGAVKRRSCFDTNSKKLTISSAATFVVTKHVCRSFVKIVRATGSSECPICLGTPVAGRVGLCGHVYCWPCVLHYAATNEKQPPPCPVCTTPLHVKNMKPTRPVQWDTPSEEVTMRLVRRLRGSTTVEIAPSSGEMIKMNNTKIMPIKNANNAPFSKLFTASKQQVQDIINRERKEIQSQIYKEIDTSEIVFMEEALKILDEKERVNREFIAPTVPAEVDEVVPIVYEKQVVNEKKFDWFNVQDQGAVYTDAIENQIAELDISQDLKLNPAAECFVPHASNNKVTEEFPLIHHEVTSEQNNTVMDDIPAVTDVDKENQAKYFYFYQAEDGQQVFHEQLECCAFCNASWENFVCRTTRKHMPCTAHLPLYCSFEIVEIDLQPPYVTNGALKSFAEELERRARIRARQERDERRREHAYRRQLEGPPKPDISSPHMFPPALSSPIDPPLFSPPVENQNHIEVSPPALTPSTSTRPSFAKMASGSGTWRPREVLGVTPPLPAEASTISHLIEVALQAGADNNQAVSKKKKRFKKTTLFASGIQRNAE